jgi:hypothetical protein
MAFFSFSSSFSSLVLDYEDDDEDELVVLFNDTRQARRVQPRHSAAGVNGLPAQPNCCLLRFVIL